MEVITQHAREQIAEYIKSELHEAVLTIDGTEEIFDLYDLILEGELLKVYILLDKQVEGDITKVQVNDEIDNVWLERDDDIDKPQDKLLLLSFRLTVSEEVVT